MKLLATLAGEIVGIITLMLVFLFVASLSGAAIDLVWPPEDGESAIVKISGNRHGLPAFLIAFVATMYTYRFVLSRHYKSKLPSSEQTPTS